MNGLRIGSGFDVHRFKEGRQLILGGVEVPFALGLEGHSDADVVIHSVCDAILGALALGDIGKLFPDTDERYKNVRSTFFLEKISKLLKENDSKVLNLDCTVIAEEPKIAPHREQMRAAIGKHLQISKENINIKGTTTEGLGFAGRKEGIACFSLVLIVRDNKA